MSEDPELVIEASGVDVIVEATGDAVAGVRHALRCVRHGRHVVMVNVEADALAGPALAAAAARGGVVYSLAWGDQPALVCDLVDWARTCGFEVACAGKGTKYLPSFHASTPDTVWEHYGGLQSERREGLNAQMFNSFIDGTKSALEMAATANATGLTPPPDGLEFPPAGSADLPEVCHGRQTGGSLWADGTVEVVSCIDRDGAPVAGDLRWGVFVVFTSSSAYALRCLPEYGIPTDSTGRYAAMIRPSHLIGLEAGVSVASVVLRAEPTGCPAVFAADLVAVAKRDLSAGERLDGEGGYAVWGKLVPSATSVRDDALPIGLATNRVLRTPIARGDVIRWSDVDQDAPCPVIALRRAMKSQIPNCT